MKLPPHHIKYENICEEGREGSLFLTPPGGGAKNPLGGAKKFQRSSCAES